MKSSKKCFPAGDRKIFELVGYALLIVGIIFLFASIPGWAWIALLGLALIVAGYILLRVSQAWR